MLGQPGIDRDNSCYYNINRCTGCFHFNITSDSTPLQCERAGCDEIISRVAALHLVTIGGMITPFSNTLAMQIYTAELTLQFITPQLQEAKDLEDISHLETASTNSGTMAAPVSTDSGITSQIHAMIKAEDSLSFLIMHNDILVALSTINYQKTTQQICLQQISQERMSDLLTKLRETHTQCLATTSHIAEISSNIMTRIDLALEYMNYATKFIYICQNCKEITLSSNFEEGFINCTQPACVSHITRIAQLLQIEEGEKVLLLEDIGEGLTRDELITNAPYIPSYSQQQFPEIDSIIKSCLNEIFIVILQTSYRLSRLQGIYAILHLIPEGLKNSFLSNISELQSTYLVLRNLVLHLSIEMMASHIT